MRRVPKLDLALERGALEAILSAWQGGADHWTGALPVAASQGDSGSDRPYEVAGGVARIPVHGPLVTEDGPCSFLTGAQSYAELRRCIQAAAQDFGVRGILLDFDTPGGRVTGVQETADVIAQARSVKPVIAYVSGMCCSAGYWLASQCERIVASPTAVVGSIGVQVVYEDDTEQMAAEGVKRVVIRASQSPRKNLDPGTEAGAAEIQARLDGLCEVFLAACGTGRKKTRAQVLADFGQGAVFVAADALTPGLIDSIAGPADRWMVDGSGAPMTLTNNRPGVPRATGDAVLTHEEALAALEELRAARAKDAADLAALRAEADAAKTVAGGLTAEVERLSGELTTITTQAAQVQAEKERAELGAILDASTREGKLPPAQRKIYERVYDRANKADGHAAAMTEVREMLAGLPVQLPKADAQTGLSVTDSKAGALARVVADVTAGATFTDACRKHGVEVQ